MEKRRKFNMVGVNTLGSFYEVVIMYIHDISAVMVPNGVVIARSGAVSISGLVSVDMEVGFSERG